MIISRSLRYQRSGTTMQKLPPGHSGLQNANARRRVYDGFPWKGAFTCKEEVREYLDHEEITCLLCGKPFRQLPFHLKKLHFVDAIDYRVRFGISPFQALEGTVSRALKSNNAKRNGLGVAFRGGTTGVECKSWISKLPQWMVEDQEDRRERNPALRRGRRARPGVDYSNLEWHFETFTTVRDYRRTPVPNGAPSWDYFSWVCLKNPKLKARRSAARSNRVAAGWAPGCAT